MGQVLHGSATTTEAVRRVIQHSQESLGALAKRYGINQKTVAKWRGRTSTADLPTEPKEPRSTALSVEEEAVIVAFRRYTLLPRTSRARRQHRHSRRFTHRTQGPRALRHALLHQFRRIVGQTGSRCRAWPLGHRKTGCIGCSMSSSMTTGRACEKATAPKTWPSSDTSHSTLSVRSPTSAPSNPDAKSPNGTQTISAQSSQPLLVNPDSMP